MGTWLGLTHSGIQPAFPFFSWVGIPRVSNCIQAINPWDIDGLVLYHNWPSTHRWSTLIAIKPLELQEMPISPSRPPYVFPLAGKLNQFPLRRKRKPPSEGRSRNCCNRSIILALVIKLTKPLVTAEDTLFLSGRADRLCSSYLSDSWIRTRDLPDEKLAQNSCSTIWIAFIWFWSGPKC